jgi:hypothetical protein
VESRRGRGAGVCIRVIRVGVLRPTAKQLTHLGTQMSGSRHCARGNSLARVCCRILSLCPASWPTRERTFASGFTSRWKQPNEHAHLRSECTDRLMVWSDGNKSLYLVFVGVVFFSASWTAFRAVRTASWTAFRAVRTATS